MWNDLFAALALVLIIEGMAPFLNPAGLRRTLTQITNLPDGTLRAVGLVSMGIGAILLYIVRR